MAKKKGLTAFIVDDNETWLHCLETDLRKMSIFSAIHTFTSYNDATLPLLENQPDVVFLDVEVPGRTGLEFLNSIRAKVTFTFKVVFYSAYTHYMLNAIRQSAFDYLLKPYKHEELEKIVKRLVEEITSEKEKNQANALGVSHKIALQTISNLLFVAVEQILMFNYLSSKRSWQITLTDLSQYTLKKGVTAEDLLSISPSLTRINNTNIINLPYLEAIENTTQRIQLCHPFEHIEIYASRRYFAELKKNIKQL